MMQEIQVWAQMFFDDGSVSEGKRIDAEKAEDINYIEEIAKKFLKGLNRNEGFLLVWGAGSINYYSIAI